jgi:hypothetical protein
MRTLVRLVWRGTRFTKKAGSTDLGLFKSVSRTAVGSTMIVLVMVAAASLFMRCPAAWNYVGSHQASMVSAATEYAVREHVQPGYDGYDAIYHGLCQPHITGWSREGILHHSADPSPDQMHKSRQWPADLLSHRTLNSTAHYDQHVLRPDLRELWHSSSRDLRPHNEYMY